MHWPKWLYPRVSERAASGRWIPKRGTFTAISRAYVQQVLSDDLIPSLIPLMNDQMPHPGACLLHHMHIMNTGERIIKSGFLLKKKMQIGAAVTLTRLACATCHDRRLVVRILSLFNEDSALGFYALKPQPAVDHTPYAAVERAVTRIAGWRHAVEDIRTVCDDINQILRRKPYPHWVANQSIPLQCQCHPYRLQ